MDGYNPSSHSILVRDIIIAWAVALAVCGIALAMPQSVQESNSSSAKAGIDIAIEEAIPSDSNIVADRGPSPEQ